jgi:protein-L-isoaspartate(D-aspartate) O-methyltransferase
MAAGARTERRPRRGVAAALVAFLGCTMDPFEVGCAEATPSEAGFAKARERMVVEQIEARGVSDPRVLAALRAVPRHEFVPAEQRAYAYEDRPLPIGEGQTISQPYIVAVMTELLRLGGDERVLEIGTGSGYQAAVLGRLAREVYTIEIVPELAHRAETDLRRLGFANVHVRTGDGYRGWPEHAPFDAIIATAAPEHVPQPLVDQLAVGGRLVLPVGDVFQDLVLVTRDEKGVREERLLGVRFVPMTGEAERRGGERP